MEELSMEVVVSDVVGGWRRVGGRGLIWAGGDC
jgi:hypothetical protein